MLNASFLGQYYPPSTIVSFPTRKGKMEGTVRRLRKYDAEVTVKGSEGNSDSIWNVSYQLMKTVNQTVKPEITLQEIHTFAKNKFNDYGLDDWIFGFDLARVRAGQCNYRQKKITLSVSFCCFASKEEVLDTVLHEIAHALVGPGHQHNNKWKTMANIIGCKGEIYHTVDHSEDQWQTKCLNTECQNFRNKKVWKRKRLIKRVRNGKCPKCKEKLTWERII